MSATRLGPPGHAAESRGRVRLGVALAIVAGVVLSLSCGDSPTGSGPSPPPPPPPPAVNSVAVSPSSATLAPGDTVRLSAEALDANGHPVAGAEFAWSSSDEAVATVDGSGLVTGVTAGQAEIVAATGGVTGRATLSVEAPTPATVSVTPDTVAFMSLGDTARLSAEVLDQFGRPLAGAAVSWASGDPSVAAVDSAGLVTAVGAGAATVTATADSVSASAAVTVMQSAGSVVVTPAEATVAPGDTVRLSAEALDANGHAVAGAEFAWSSSDGSVATVDASGIVTGVADGSATVTAAAGDARGTSEITVANPDRAALVALYEATDGPNWADNDGWLTDAPLGDWYGVDTDGSGRVIQLRLGGRWDAGSRRWIRHGLQGSIPAELGSLANLRTLSLFANALTGPVPAELGELVNLGLLDLSYNDLSGPIPPELGNLANLRSLGLWGNDLSGRIPPELGNLAKLIHLQLAANDLSGPIPPEIGNLANLRVLRLDENALTGVIPPELGNLANLTELILAWNGLTGPIPSRLLQLDELRSFWISQDDWYVSQNGFYLCVPGTAAFFAWWQRIESRDEEAVSCNAGDIAVLTSLFEAARGSDWTRSDGWLGDFALGGWHGVSADSLGRVTELDLSRNGLAGHLPVNMGELARMTELRIEGNTALSGRLPLSLSSLALQTLHYVGTGLCAPANTSFRDWLGTISSHEATGAECEPLSNREVLEALHEATGGADWDRDENWLTDAPLGEWYGVEVDERGRVVGLRLGGNDLTGRIPPELGGLTSLRRLEFTFNPLTGPIPGELGDLANLEFLYLGPSRLTGPIPSELGDLAKLRYLDLGGSQLTGPVPLELTRLAALVSLDLSENGLTGRIPPEFSRLTRLGLLSLGENDLTGSIPPELGSLGNVFFLNLAANRLTGRIPPELGRLGHLRALYLGGNELAGPVPSAFGGLTELRTLSLQNNHDMSGALPVSFSNLTSLETLQTGGTSLCAPRDADFLGWLENVVNRRVALCGGEPAMAYLVQAVQSREFPVPLVAGEDALLRVFVTATLDNNERLPPMRASFHLNGALAHTVDIPGKPGPIPTEVGEESLAASANAVVPAEMVRPGLEMVVEIDPDRTLDPGLGVTRRIPPTGRLSLEVRELPLFDLTLLPFVWTQTGDSSIVDLVDEMTADPYGHELLEKTHTLLPVGDLEVRAHDPVLSSSNYAFDLLAQTAAIRAMEGGTGYYLGTMSGRVTGPSGIAGGWSAFSVPDPFTIAHELGHCLGLWHAPGAPGADPAYPNADGTIGAWGYDLRNRGVVPPSAFDLMGYVAPLLYWVSDYHFTKALRFRLARESTAGEAADAPPANSLLLWGSVDSEGAPFLEPTFVVKAPPSLPESGVYSIVGLTADGGELFSLSFDMPEVADGDGSSSFAFALPVRPAWEESLASITLTGPGGSFTLDGESDRPMAILRDPRTGQVRGFLRDLPPATLTRADAVAAVSPEPGLEVLFSRGIPGAEAWRR